MKVGSARERDKGVQMETGVHGVQGVCKGVKGAPVPCLVRRSSCGAQRCPTLAPSGQATLTQSGRPLGGTVRT
jgi:hypothetical protein